MRVFRGLEEIPPFRAGTVVAVGNFDGLHPGHRRILRRVVWLARRKKLASLVLTFDPHPARSFKGKSVPLLQTFEARLDGIARAGIANAVVLPFNKAFSRLSGRAFAGGILAARLGAKDVVVGRNFRFGFRRVCGTDDLDRLGREFGFAVHVVAPVIHRGEPLSSSRIRALVADGRVAEAAEALGRPYEISGRVVPGAGRGTKLGIPTANLRTESEILPPGVFLTRAGSGRRLLPSVTNVGTAPTFGRGAVLPEIHILGARKPRLPDREFRVLFLKKIRNERRFASPSALVRRIRRDIEEARLFFRRG